MCRRSVARRADELERLRDEGLPEPERSGAAALTPERRAALAEIDPGWCPAWGIEWQRTFRLAWAHVKAVGSLPGTAGTAVVDGEDLGAWAAAQSVAFPKLASAQQWMLTKTLGITAAAALPRTHAQRWDRNLAAARQYRAREGHLGVPRGHIEHYDGEDIRLGAWISQQRVAASKLKMPAARVEALAALNMRWPCPASSPTPSHGPEPRSTP